MPTLTAAATLRLPDSSNEILLSGTNTVTSLLSGNTILPGREVTFVGSSGVTTFTNTTGTTTNGQMDLGGVNIAISAKDVLCLIQLSNGSWRVVSVRYNNATSNSLASATTTVVPDTGDFFVLTGTATITTLTGTTNSRGRIVTFVGGASCAATFTNTNSPSSGQMFLQGANVVLLEQDVLQLFLNSDGTWYLVNTTAA